MSDTQNYDYFVLPPNPKRTAEGGLRFKGLARKFSADKPVISAVTVVFNGAERIAETIQSVINQNYLNVEYIIIDGCSTDSTIDIIKKYQDKIDYWVSEPDAGIYEAMNKGWLLCSRKSYVIFLGAGDKILSLPNKERFMPPNQVIYGIVKKEDGTVWHSWVNWALKCHNTLHHQALLVPKQLHPQPPFDASLKVFGDFDFNQRLYKQGAHFIRADEFVAYFAKAGICSKFPMDEYLKVIRKNYGPFWVFVRKTFNFLKKIKRSFSAKK